MKCELCKENEATIHLTEVINDKVTKLHICESCAKIKSEEMQSAFGLTDLLSGLMDSTTELGEEPQQEDVSLKCPVCGMTYYTFQKVGRLGCGNCYEAFSKEMDDLLTKIHGSNKHIGKMPFKSKEAVQDQQSLKGMKNKLKDLVQSEDFEQAALLRDRIKELEEKLGE